MAKPIVVSQIQERQIVPKAECVLEGFCNEFSEDEVSGICSDRVKIHPSDTSRMMQSMNHTKTLCRGLSVILRIAGGNDVLKDEFDPDIPETTPISNDSIDALIYMAATVCDMISNDISQVADACSWRKS